MFYYARASAMAVFVICFIFIFYVELCTRT
jgi:hypothetical protein